MPNGHMGPGGSACMMLDGEMATVWFDGRSVARMARRKQELSSCEAVTHRIAQLRVPRDGRLPEAATQASVL